MKINAFDDPRLQLAECHLYVEQCYSCEDALFWLRTVQVLEAGEGGFDPLCRYDHLGRVLADTVFRTHFGPGPSVDADVIADEDGMASDEEHTADEAYGRAWRDALFTYIGQTGASPHELLQVANVRLKGHASRHDPDQHRRC
jgi:hypothetical protein